MKWNDFSSLTGFYTHQLYNLMREFLRASSREQHPIRNDQVKIYNWNRSACVCVCLRVCLEIVIIFTSLAQLVWVQTNAEYIDLYSLLMVINRLIVLFFQRQSFPVNWNNCGLLRYIKRTKSSMRTIELNWHFLQVRCCFVLEVWLFGWIFRFWINILCINDTTNTEYIALLVMSHQKNMKQIRHNTSTVKFILRNMFFYSIMIGIVWMKR